MLLCTNVLLANNVLPRTPLAWRLQDALVRLAMSVLKTNEAHGQSKLSFGGQGDASSGTGIFFLGNGMLAVVGSLTMILP